MRGSILGLALLAAMPAASAAAQDFVVTAKAAKVGSIVPSGRVEVAESDTPVFTIAPVDPAMHEIRDVLVDRVSVGPVASYTFDPIDDSHRIVAKFRKRRYTVTVLESLSSLGSFSPTGLFTTTYGKRIQLTATPDEGVPAFLLVDDQPPVAGEPGETLKHSLTVTADHVVAARFGWPCENGGDDPPACTPPDPDIHAAVGGAGLACTVGAPCALSMALAKAVAGSVVHLAPGTYAGTFHLVGKSGTEAEPVTVLGQPGAVVEGGIVVDRSSWVALDGLEIEGVDTVTVVDSHFVTVRGARLDHRHAGVFTRDSSHLLVEDSELFQSFPPGSTWSDLKGSSWEGGGFLASSGGMGTYVIRRNHFHDAFNGVLLTDDDSGTWMNANVLVHDNLFEDIVDDPFEPEGDSFNVHFFGNTLRDTHRMASLVPATSCVGPIFVYGNVQQNEADPTGEAEEGRLNSALKVDTSSGECPGGIHVFHNTVRGVAGNFHGLDLLDPEVHNLALTANVFVTELDVCSSTPDLHDSLFDHNLSQGPFGAPQPNGIVADPMLQPDGSLAPGSPAIGAGPGVSLPGWFASDPVVAAGADLGAFVTFPAPVFATPPGGPPPGFPSTPPGWPGP